MNYRYFLIIYIFFYCFSISPLFAQKIANEKIIEENSSTKIKIFNAYGGNVLSNGSGNIQDNNGCGQTEVVDLGKNGFIFRNELIVKLYNNEFELISEKDISALFNKNNNSFTWITTEKGVFLYQEQNIFKPEKVLNIGFLSYSGELKIINLDINKDENFFYVSEYNNGIKVGPFGEEQNYHVIKQDLSIQRNVPKSTFDGEKIFNTEEKVLSNFLINETDLFRLSDFDDQGVTTLSLINVEGSTKNVKFEIKIELPEVANSKTFNSIWVIPYSGGPVKLFDKSKEKSFSKGSQYRVEHAGYGEYYSAYDEVNNLIYVVFNLFCDKQFVTLTYDINTNKINKNIYKQEDLESLNINTNDFNLYTIYNHLNYNDWFYQIHKDHLFLFMHTRSIGGRTSLNIGSGYFFKIDHEGKISGVDKIKQGNVINRHYNYLFVPNYFETVYSKNPENPCIIDYALSLCDTKANGSTAIAVLPRKSYNIVIKVEEKPSKVTAYKVVD